MRTPIRIPEIHPANEGGRSRHGALGCSIVREFVSISRPASSNSEVANRRMMGRLWEPNPENEAQPKVDECFVRKISQLNGPLGGPFIESSHDLHEPTSQQDDRAPQ